MCARLLSRSACGRVTISESTLTDQQLPRNPELQSFSRLIIGCRYLLHHSVNLTAELCTFGLGLFKVPLLYKASPVGLRQLLVCSSGIPAYLVPRCLCRLGRLVVWSKAALSRYQRRSRQTSVIRKAARPTAASVTFQAIIALPFGLFDILLMSFHFLSPNLPTDISNTSPHNTDQQLSLRFLTIRLSDSPAGRPKSIQIPR